MELIPYQLQEIKVVEIRSDQVLIQTADDGLKLLGDMYYQGYDGIIIREENITIEFFNLKTGIAGEILQKFSNYRMKLTIVGNFTNYTSKSIVDFMRESNERKQINFVAFVEEALKKLSNQ